MAEPNKADVRRLEDLRAANRTREAQLAAQGVRIDQDSMFVMQVQALRNAMCAADPTFEVAYGIAFQEVIAEAFAAVGDDVTRTRLVAGTPAQDGARRLHVPGNGQVPGQ